MYIFRTIKIILIVIIAFAFMTGCSLNIPVSVTIESEIPVETPNKTAEPSGLSETTAEIIRETETITPEETSAESTTEKTVTTNPITQKPTVQPSTPKPIVKPTIKPDGRLTGIVIGIDPGHQGKGNHDKEPVAPGSSTMKSKVSYGTQGKWTRVPEYEVTLNVGLALKELLVSQGATVIMSRETHNVDISNSQRATMMNDKNVDLVIRIHCNGNNNTSVYGACMLVPSGSNNKEIHNLSTEAGKVILKEFIEATGTKDNGVIKRSDLTGFNWSTVPVCLIEMGYMSNKDEDYKLTSKQYQEKCVDGLYRGILEYFI